MTRKIAFALLLVTFAACNNTEKNEVPVNKGIRVKTTTVQMVADITNLSYSGTVEAAQVIPLTFRTTGTVEQIFVEVGDPVKKGQVLATLGDDDLQNIYNTMLAKYQQAEDAYNRLKQVHEQGSLPDIKWAEMQSNYDQAKSSLELAKNNLDKCRLVAPVTGFVGRRNIEPGQSSVSLTGAPIELVKIEKVMIKISVPENEINKIEKNQAATMTVSALGGKSFVGTVTNISPVAELMSRTYTVKISVDNAGLDLKPGMVCDVSIPAGTGSEQLVVPLTAVSRDSYGISYVFVVSQDRQSVKKQPVTVGQYSGAGIVITGGLSAGQVIVSEGIEKLSDNSKILL